MANSEHREPISFYLSSSISRLDSLSERCLQSASRLSISSCNFLWRRRFSSFMCLSSLIKAAIFSASKSAARRRESTSLPTRGLGDTACFHTYSHALWRWAYVCTWRLLVSRSWCFASAVIRLSRRCEEMEELRLAVPVSPAAAYLMVNNQNYGLISKYIDPKKCRKETSQTSSQLQVCPFFSKVDWQGLPALVPKNSQALPSHV